jgi:TPR repeat protein
MTFFKRMKLKSLLKKVKKLYQLREQGANTDIKNEITALHAVAEFYTKNHYNEAFPNSPLFAFEYYRAAASLGDAKAQYLCGKELLDQAKFWEEWEKGMYADAIHTQNMTDRYAEAFKYLSAAESNGYALASRLHGLAYIHGWGVEKNTNTGFKYVLDSIEMDKAWDKATKILEELKLNSPEFFAALMAYKSGKEQ